MKMKVLLGQNYFNLIHDSILLMMKDMENPLSLHPNKHPFLIEFFENRKICVESSILTNFPIETAANIKLQKIQDILTLPATLENQIIQLGDKGDIRINHFLNFESDLKEVLNRKPILIDEGTFCACWAKSNVSTSFVLGDETFLVWPGSHNTEKGEFWIHIYNISLMKKEIIFKGGESKLSVVSSYPKIDGRIHSERKWLYCADNSGIFKLFDLSKSNQFKEILIIETAFKKGILSAIVFEDLYGNF